VLAQLRRDPRTLALLLAVPCVLVTLIEQVFAGERDVFQRVGPPLLGVFPLVSMFLVASIAVLRERTSGTLERLLTMPLAKLDLLLGYGAAFALVAVIQGAVVSLLAIGLLGLDIAGSALLVLLLAVANALLGMALGLFVSAFAATEFQAVQFMPAFLLPQILVCGLFVSRDAMARWLQLLSDVLPMTYAYDAIRRVAASPSPGGRVAVDAGVVLGCTLVALALGAATLRRRTP
jgi:ABC-2 type transport system permease protein